MIAGAQSCCVAGLSSKLRAMTINQRQECSHLAVCNLNLTKKKIV